jgi:hypothetical protein
MSLVSLANHQEINSVISSDFQSSSAANKFVLDFSVEVLHQGQPPKAVGYSSPHIGHSFTCGVDN